MRIACIYLPSFPLQVHVRSAPHLAGESFAVADTGADRPATPTVLVCSRAAWNEGVRPGMPVTRARAVAPGARFLQSDPALYRRALEALAESLMSYSDAVDVGRRDGAGFAHQALYLRVPSSARGASFGEKLLTQLSRQGFRGRVGIADDRFTAWAAAATVRERAGEQPARAAADHADHADHGHSEQPPLFAQACTSVPRGGSAVFLAPLSITLLPLDRDILEVLTTLGIRTLGDFATLPPPTVGSWSDAGIDYQALARGDGSAVVAPFSPWRPVAERIELEREVRSVEPLSFVLRPVIERACERLRGRGRAVGDARLRLLGGAGQVDEIPIVPPHPTVTAQTLVDLARRALASRPLTAPVLGVEVEVTGEVDPEVEDLDLPGVFDGRVGEASTHDVEMAIARLRSDYGAGARGEDDAAERESIPVAQPQARTPHRRTRRRKERRRPPTGKGEAPQPLAGAQGELELREPPENYQVEADDGGRHWVFRKQADGRYYLHGIID